jgi:hypothetical protein
VATLPGRSRAAAALHSGRFTQARAYALRAGVLQQMADLGDRLADPLDDLGESLGRLSGRILGKIWRIATAIIGIRTCDLAVFRRTRSTWAGGFLTLRDRLDELFWGAPFGRRRRRAETERVSSV